MTLADAARTAAGTAAGTTTQLHAVQAESVRLGRILAGPAVQFSLSDDPAVHMVSTAPAQAVRSDIRELMFMAAAAQLRMFRATPTELAQGVLRPNDPRLRMFRASFAELRTFHATAMEQAAFTLRPNDPRRNIFRATGTEMAISWRNLIAANRPIGGL